MGGDRRWRGPKRNRVIKGGKKIRRQNAGRGARRVASTEKCSETRLCVRASARGSVNTSLHTGTLINELALN